MKVGKIMLKKLFKKKTSLLTIAGFIIVSLFAIPFAKASQPRDYDNNSVIYGGAYTVSELRGDLSNGTGKPNQSAYELKKLFSHLGMGIENLTTSTLQDGVVSKNGNVTVNGKIVAYNALSMGRNKTAHSTQVSGVSYPIYWRPTSDSFVSGSIPAFVYINYDGSMAFAIIKSCGNPVKGVGIRVKPVTTYKVTVNKFNDLNGNMTKENTEPMLPNWSFRITGSNYDQTVQTTENGTITVSGLKAGTYTVTEIQKAGWTNTTPLQRTITITNSDLSVWFGNRLIPVQPSDTFTIRARKFEDLNGNAKREDNEPWLAGWTIRLTGNNLDRTFETNNEGTVIFSNLPAGTYTVSEVQQSGWTNITPLSQSVVVPNQATLEGYVEFGNKRIAKPVAPTGVAQPLPTSGPLDSVLGSLGGISLASAGIYYRRGKKNLNAAFKTVK